MTLTARELAHQLGLPASYLRQLIRDHNLMPGHRWGERYAFEEEDVARITREPAVRMAVEAGGLEQRGESYRPASARLEAVTVSVTGPSLPSRPTGVP